jgi:hypothetical protein
MSGLVGGPLHRVPVVRLPPDFGPVTDAFICSTTRKVVPDDGEWLFQEARRITGGLEELLPVYAMPDARPTPTNDTSTVEQICPLSLSITPPIWLHGAAVLAVRPPLGRCGNPIRGVYAALRRLTTQVVVSEPVRQVSSQLSIDSGCPIRARTSCPSTPNSASHRRASRRSRCPSSRTWSVPIR